MTKILCIYHGNCADGFGAAWAVRDGLALYDIEFYPGVHQQPPPDVTGHDVIIVDFSYKYDVLTEMSYKANSTLILDHHKTAAEDLSKLPVVVEKDGYSGFRGGALAVHCRDNNMPHIGALFDMDRSGARIAWDFFNRGKEPPALINHIQDRDLWQFKLEGTREIQAAVFSYPYDFEVWDRLMFMDVQELRSDGGAIERKHFKDIKEFIAVAGSRMTIAGHDVPCLNAPYFWSSDAGHIMSENEPFAACYWDTDGQRGFSLRSNDGGLDVSEIAKLFGGGGHKNAAGFSMPHTNPDAEAAE